MSFPHDTCQLSASSPSPLSPLFTPCLCLSVSHLPPCPFSLRLFPLLQTNEPLIEHFPCQALTPVNWAASPWATTSTTTLAVCWTEQPATRSLEPFVSMDDAWWVISEFLWCLFQLTYLVEDDRALHTSPKFHLLLWTVGQQTDGSMCSCRFVICLTIEASLLVWCWAQWAGEQWRQYVCCWRQGWWNQNHTVKVSMNRNNGPRAAEKLHRASELTPSDLSVFILSLLILFW